jgi:hypothetical protein
MIAAINPARAKRSSKATPMKKKVFATFPSLLKELHSLTSKRRAHPKTKAAKINTTTPKTTVNQKTRGEGVKVLASNGSVGGGGGGGGDGGKGIPMLYHLSSLLVIIPTDWLK